MRTLLKIFVAGLLVLLVLALGTVVVTRRRGVEVTGLRPAPLVVVRKGQHPAEHCKTVQPVIR